MVNLELRLDGRVVAKLDIDRTLLSQLLGVGRAGVLAPERETVRSAPLTPAQAAALMQSLEAGHRAFLHRLVEERGALTWGETKALFGLRSWEDFAAGPGKAIEKQVQRLLDDKNASLIWRVEHEWIGLEKGEDEVCRLHIDGPALAALAESFAGAAG